MNSLKPTKRKNGGGEKSDKRRKFGGISPDTQQVIDLVLQGKNVEIIGPAGTGKSFTLKRLIATLKRRHLNFAITASTGKAAIHIGGQTIHSFSGAGIGDQELEVYLKKIKRSRWYRNQWTKTRVLIIEEISMLNKDYFDLLDNIARSIRKKDEPFGGLQVVVCGDYLQLPPVDAGFAFEAEAYKALKFQTVVFRNVKRQSCPRLLRMLAEARIGQLTAESIKLLQDCVDKKVPADLGIEPTLMFARRAQVRDHNLERLNRLPGKSRIFKHSFVESPSLSTLQNEMVHRSLCKNVQAPPELKLKVGAQVMLVRNMMHLRKFNGSMGIVTKFHPTTNAPTVKFADQTEMEIPKCEWKGPNGKGCYIQYPLLLGWCSTIHKSQV